MLHDSVLRKSMIDVDKCVIGKSEQSCQGRFDEDVRKVDARNGGVAPRQAVMQTIQHR